MAPPCHKDELTGAKGVRFPSLVPPAGAFSPGPTRVIIQQRSHNLIVSVAIPQTARVTHSS